MLSIEYFVVCGAAASFVSKQQMLVKLANVCVYGAQVDNCIFIKIILKKHIFNHKRLS